MTSELKPCPFCGAKAKFKGGRLSQDSVTIWCENLHRSGGFATKEAAAADWNTRAVPDVPELVTVAKQYRWGGDPKWRTFPPIFKDDTLEVRELVLHSQAVEIIAADRAEKHRAQEAVLKLERELAQYEAQEPVAHIQSCDLKWLSHDNYGSITITTSKSTTHTEPLYTSPAPVVDLKAENERLREALGGISRNTCCSPCREAALIARAALNVEASNDKG